MRVGKTIFVGVLCWVLAQTAGVMAQQQGADLESLLKDINVPTESTNVAADQPVTPSETAPSSELSAAGVEPAAIAVEPTSAPVVEPSTEAAVGQSATVEVDVVSETAVTPEGEVTVGAAEVTEAPAEPTVAEPLAVETKPADETLGTEPAPELETPALEAEPVAESPVVEAAPVEPVAVDVERLFSPEGTAAATDEALPEETPSVEPAAGELTPAATEPAPAEVVEPAAAAEGLPVEMAPAEATVAAESIVAPPPPQSAEVARELAEKEKVRRQAEEQKGLELLKQAERDLKNGNYAEAQKKFRGALESLPVRKQTEQARDRSAKGLAEALYNDAQAIYADSSRKKGTLLDARNKASEALKFNPELSAAKSLLERIEKQEALDALPKPVKSRPETIERQKTVADFIKEGRQYFDVGDYDRAELMFDKVLLEDKYNVTAMRYLKKIDDIRYKINTKEREATVAARMAQVRDAWNPPIRVEVDAPTTPQGQGTIETKTANARLQERMQKIIIPTIEFRQANITDVINFLVEASVAGDPEGTGVNIILNLSRPGASESTAAPKQAAPALSDDPFAPLEGDMGMMAAPEAAAGSDVKTITLNLRRISLLDAIKYITEVAGLKFRIEENAVIITPADVASGRIVTRMYPVQPSILDVIVSKDESAAPSSSEFGGGEMSSARTTISRAPVKDFFEKAGVQFPAGTSITYNPSISQIIVANTPDNLDVFERILTQLNVVPNQVEIEARFVEVGEQDLEELGFQWFLTDNFVFAQKNGSGPIASRERMQINADPYGFTKGLRFWNADKTTGADNPKSSVTRDANQESLLGNILSVSSILTSPEVTMVLQAISQHGGSDLLSAPRVTTRSGQNAQIQVVKEIIYPTEFEVTQPTVQSQGDLVTPPTVTPGSFEKRDVGVILNVTPTVGPDGYTIDLVMVPEVAELVDWIQYGSEITLETGTVLNRQERTFQFNIPQPVFTSRKVNTSIVIWDGQTVVMGGLIREDMVTIKDKIPFLGDIPLLGRLFRTEGQHSQKMNLLIFVTARLVDPSGKPIHKAEATALPGGGVTAGETQQP